MRITLIVATLLIARTAFAYPQFVAKGYTNCGTCHYSATGGGLLNSYGHATLEAMVPTVIESEAIESLQEWVAKRDVTGFDDEDNASLQWDVGLDARLLFVQAPKEVNGDDTLLVIPMLIEAGGVLAGGPWMAYGTLTPRRTGAESQDLSAFSREHWLQYRVDETMSLRAGRMVLPFGLRIPDHTQYVREDLGFGKWDQSYALQLDRYTDNWMLSVAAFAGDYLATPAAASTMGGVFSAAYNLPGRGTVGLSGLVGKASHWTRAATSLFVRLRLLESSYLLGEAVAQHRWLQSGDDPTNLAGYLRMGWFAFTSLDVFLEAGSRYTVDAFKLTKLRYMAGLNWQALPWLELVPSLLFEETPETGMSVSYISQLHIIY